MIVRVSPPPRKHDIHAAVAAVLAVLGSVGWLNSELATLRRGDSERVAAEAQTRADLREIREQLTDCRRAR